MSKYYGVVFGARGEAHRTGTAKSGLTSTVQTMNGSVIVSVYVGKDGKNKFDIQIAEDTSSGYGAKTYFSGSLEELKQQLTK